MLGAAKNGANLGGLGRSRGNHCVPARYVGDKLTVKADASSLTIYDQLHEIVHYRSWQLDRMVTLRTSGFG